MTSHPILRQLRNAVLLFTLSAGVMTGLSRDKDRDPICGKWKWISGEVHQFGPGGHVVGEKGCTWRRVGSKPPRYVVTWRKDYVDTLHLSKSGDELRGKNNEGGEVWGTRIEK